MIDGSVFSYSDAHVDDGVPAQECHYARCSREDHFSQASDMQRFQGASPARGEGGVFRVERSENSTVVRPLLTLQKFTICFAERHAYKVHHTRMIRIRSRIPEVYGV